MWTTFFCHFLSFPVTIYFHCHKWKYMVGSNQQPTTRYNYFIQRSIKEQPRIKDICKMTLALRLLRTKEYIPDISHFSRRRKKSTRKVVVIIYCLCKCKRRPMKVPVSALQHKIWGYFCNNLRKYSLGRTGAFLTSSAPVKKDKQIGWTESSDYNALSFLQPR